jgi:hypothetical protein
MSKILDSLDVEIGRAVELEERIYSLLGETRQGWELIAELSRLNYEIGFRLGVN